MIKENNRYRFDKLIEEWMNSHKSHLKGNTKEMYERIIEKHLIPELGEYPICDINTSILQNFLERQTLKGLTRSAEQSYMVLKQFFTYVYDVGYIDKDIAYWLEKPRVKHTPVDTLTLEEEAFIKTVELELKQKVLVNLFLYLGLSRGEALGLQKKDFDFNNNTVIIERFVCFENEGLTSVLKEYTVNNKERRCISIPSDIRETLFVYINTMEDKNISAFLFTNADDRIITKSGYRRMWNKIIEAFKEVNPQMRTLNAQMLKKTYDSNINESWGPYAHILDEIFVNLKKNTCDINHRMDESVQEPYEVNL